MPRKKKQKNHVIDYAKSDTLYIIGSELHSDILKEICIDKNGFKIVHISKSDIDIFVNSRLVNVNSAITLLCKEKLNKKGADLIKELLRSKTHGNTSITKIKKAKSVKFYIDDEDKSHKANLKTNSPQRPLILDTKHIYKDEPVDHYMLEIHIVVDGKLDYRNLYITV